MITAVVLTYQRPKLVQRCLAELQGCELISEILVVNNGGANILGSSRITVMNMSRNIGLFFRYSVGTAAMNDAVLYVDDDMLIPPDTVTQLYQHWLLEPEILHGIIGRNLKPDGTYAISVEHCNAECDIALHGAVTHRKYARAFFTSLDHPVIISAFKKNALMNSHPHNGEDILFSYTARAHSKRRHHIYNLPWKMMTGEGPAVWKFRDHNVARTMIALSCQQALSM